MPIYEYVCSDCNHHLEKLQKMSDAPLVDCPACGHPALKKQISAAGFQLKGNGWYATDFKPRTDKTPSSTERCAGSTCPAGCPGAASAK
ncbi:FmdB family zinc ribbon protein [Edwardsiella tarda]|uniref:Zinc ribbon domain-containing protein n=3 Tax=Edwardsiella tarda TaxID=636 RepID=A0A2A7U3M1_EDWTA|nr:zinc ribbon domain-containing protein [Edwardsiella tarda]ATI63032.1 zinc ribbon domain-containing protein [Edwardsiella tarda]PEH73022.1 zinc ribbon domain-containing protein [Edwardsiella tarda]UAL54925.1 zinc ribbon domain-containing protein [Edwardsiella tarda]UBU95201.1 zinc ribbon domain-containing protein [Edwardsiella tarda]UCP99016.1 zinc ribbon domain-containing protein [Edwardsiella tarda ATCC 15947 = NBRC 105688]